MSSNGNVGLIRLSNDIDLNHKHIINLGCEQDINFKKELIKVLEEGLEKLAFTFNELKCNRDKYSSYSEISFCFKDIANSLRKIKK